MTIKSTRSFKSNAERVLRNAHPDASVGIEWTHAASVKWADGTKGFSGVFKATAPGYRTRNMVASFSHGELAVR